MHITALTSTMNTINACENLICVNITIRHINKHTHTQQNKNECMHDAKKTKWLEV